MTGLRHSLSLALLCLSGALAYVPAPSTAQINQALEEGRRLAQNRDSGYPLKAYTLYAVADTLKLEAKNGAVDAVTIATPFERTRYQAFLSVLGQDPVTAQQARERADLPDGSVQFIVYAHGMQPTDRDFLDRFSAATLRLGNETLKPSRTERSDTDASQYPKTVGEVGIRFVGTITYQFEIPARLKDASGTLSFTDASGKSFKVPVNLSKYR